MEFNEHDIGSMFDSIAYRYDLLNHLLSGYTDVRWRKKAVRVSLDKGIRNILDVSTGTGDLAVAYKRAGYGYNIFGVDISMEMLKRASLKTTDTGFIKASALSLPFRDNTFDLLSCAFGIRNIYPRETGLKEFHRVLKPNGVLMILEFSMPAGFFGKVYKFYFENILQKIGAFFTKTGAYSYLTSSVEEFPDSKGFSKKIDSAGFKDTKVIPLTYGIATIYKAVNMP
ncbi:MAG: ubiquinone/menaquinone biosynthesis methyltransferase [Deltaproteobacteria bacterium]|nr:ubiquinone/menaquinone biosynthesis methyltransferase [Deltaproteobacteria bacterium]MCL5791447.1 ubiquinone/menaquinone biosynthesis methyltransferase [Deltaproteobacteria bacterium]